MKWKSCRLQIITNQTEDALGNMTGGEWKTVKDTYCRFTPWTDLQVSLGNISQQNSSYGSRNATKNEQRFAIPVPYCRFPKCTHAVIDGVRQKITEIIDLSPRYTLIQVEVYKK